MLTTTQKLFKDLSWSTAPLPLPQSLETEQARVLSKYNWDIRKLETIMLPLLRPYVLAACQMRKNKKETNKNKQTKTTFQTLSKNSLRFHLPAFEIVFIISKTRNWMVRGQFHAFLKYVKDTTNLYWTSCYNGNFCLYLSPKVQTFMKTKANYVTWSKPITVIFINIIIFSLKLSW